MNYYCISDIGLYRDKNQDSFLAIENNYGDFLAIVADGVGGGKAGEIASGELVKYFKSIFKESGPFNTLENAIDFINYHIDKANSKIFNMSVSKEDYSGMSTTLTGVLMTSFGTISINCGDSRVYGFIDNKYFRLTTDHNLGNQMLENGQITFEETINHPKKQYLYLVKAMGIFPEIKADVHKVKDMDYFLISSDGLHGYVSEEEISKIILDESKTIEDRVIDLKDIALMKGGYDNITVVLIKR